MLAAVLPVLAVSCRRQEAPAEVPILMYHRVSDGAADPWTIPPAVFEEQIRSLAARGYKSVLPSDLAAHCSSGQPLPARPVVLTFDDGDRSLTTTVEPILARHGFRAIAYLPTGSIAPDGAARRTMEYATCLTWKEVREMRSRGVVAFGVHGHRHERLAELSAPEADVNEATRIFRENLQCEPDSFAYPFGSYNRRVVNDVRRAGYKTAVTCSDRMAILESHTSLLKLPRILVEGGEHRYSAELIPAIQGSRTVTFHLAHRGITISGIPRLVLSGAGGEGSWSQPVQLFKEASYEWAWNVTNRNILAPCSARLEISDPHLLFCLYASESFSVPQP
jgi:peptidoglycan/xylan/chitin deacetylase (PgdA/CDA1 family)